MVDLSTRYLGLELETPLVASCSPLTGQLDSLLELEDAGASAVVLPSLFEEQVEQEAMAIHHGIEFGAEAFAEAAGGYLPGMDDYNTGPTEYLELVRRAKEELSIPVIGSLNGTSQGGWTLYGRILEDSGIDALELNVYLVAADVETSGEAIERQYLDLVEDMRKAVDVPLAVKVGPYFSSMANMAKRLAEAGADGLVIFNRFYQPDFDLDELAVSPNLQLSHSAEGRLVLRWLAILFGRIQADMAATTGIHEPEDAVKAILAGANVTMMTSALLRRGPGHLTTVADGVRRWFEERDYVSVEQARGSLSQQNTADPAAYERVNYMRTLASYSSV